MKRIAVSLVCIVCFASSHIHEHRESVASKPKADSLEALLDALLLDVITRASDEAHNSMESYGTPGDREIVLVNGNSHVPWPESYGSKEINGWRLLSHSKYRPPAIKDNWNVNRKLGVGINLLCINAAVLGAPGRGPIILSLFNTGGSKNGNIMGMVSFSYSAEYKNGKWVVSLRAIDS